MGLGFREVAKGITNALNLGEDEDKIEVLAASLADVANKSVGTSGSTYHSCCPNTDGIICGVTSGGMIY